MIPSASASEALNLLGPQEAKFPLVSTFQLTSCNNIRHSHPTSHDHLHPSIGACTSVVVVLAVDHFERNLNRTVQTQKTHLSSQK